MNSALERAVRPLAQAGSAGWTAFRERQQLAGSSVPWGRGGLCGGLGRGGALGPLSGQRPCCPPHPAPCWGPRPPWRGAPQEGRCLDGVTQGGAPLRPPPRPRISQWPLGAVASRTRKGGCRLPWVTALAEGKRGSRAPRGRPSGYRHKMGTLVTAEADPEWEGVGGGRRASEGGMGGAPFVDPDAGQGRSDDPRPPVTEAPGSLAGPGDGRRAALTHDAARWRCRPAPGGGTGRRVRD